MRNRCSISSSALSGQNLTVDTVHQLLEPPTKARPRHRRRIVGHGPRRRWLEIRNDIVNQGQQLGELLEQ